MATATKSFVNVKTELGICVVDGKVSYGMHVKGLLTESAKSAFTVLNTDKDTTSDIPIDTYLFIMPNRTEISEVQSDKAFNWFFGNSKKPDIPLDISEGVRKLILADMNKVKGVFKDSFNPIQELPDPEDVNTIMDHLESLGVIKDCFEYANQLDLELTKDKRASATVGLDDFIERYAFTEHILLAGPAGSSKTFTADRYLKEHGCSIEFVSGHEGLESTDLLGYSIRHTDGSFIWMDGPLTAAFRQAQTSPTGLMIDELLRIPAKERNILIGALTPNSSKEFVLRTNRITDITDGIGRSETLTVPMSNLWVVATTNIGADYEVEDMDLALNDRFITHDVFTNDTQVLQIMNSNNINTLSESTVTKLMSLYKAITALVQAQELTNTMNVRHLTKVLKNVKDPATIKSYLFDLAPNVCSRTVEGKLNGVELKIYKDTVKSIF